MRDTMISNDLENNFLPPESGHVHVGPLFAIPQLLRDHALESPEQILAEVGLELSLFDNPENTISFVKLGQLLRLGSTRTGIPHFGLMVGRQASLEQLGPLSQMALNAPDSGTAIHDLILHLSIHDRGGIPTLSSSKDMTTLGYAIYLPMQEGVSHILTGSISIITNVMRSLCGRDWAPTEVHISQSRPDNIKPYKEFFRSKLVFDSDQTTLVYPSRWMSKPITGADARLHHSLAQQLTTMEAQIEFDILEKVRLILRPLVSSRTCTNERVARALSMHERTLNRRLHDQGTTFRKLVSEARYENAKQLLRLTDIPVTEISIILGYSETCVLTRAFRRWSGMAPVEWRMQFRS